MTIAGGCRCCEEIERGKPINFEWNKCDRSDFIWFNSLKDKSPYMLNYLNVKGSQTSPREGVIVGTEGWRNCIFPMAIISSSSSSFLFLLISLMSCDVMLCRPPKEFWEHTLQICNNHPGEDRTNNIHRTWYLGFLPVSMWLCLSPPIRIYHLQIYIKNRFQISWHEAETILRNSKYVH